MISVTCIGVGAELALGGGEIFARNYMHEILTKYPNFTYICQKSNKITEYYIFARKCPNFMWYLPENTQIFHDICPKNIFTKIWGGARARPAYDDVHTVHTEDQICRCDSWLWAQSGANVYTP